MPPRRYTDLQLACAVAESKNMREVVAKLGLVPCGSNYENVRQRIRDLHIEDPFHGIRQSPVRDVPDEQIREAVPGARSRADVLRRLGLEPTVTIALELHHKNGDRLDNRLENLAIYCPNCHSQTDSYRGRNIGKAAGYSSSELS